MEKSLQNYFDAALFQPNKEYKKDFRNPKPLSRKNTMYSNIDDVITLNDLYD